MRIRKHEIIPECGRRLADVVAAWRDARVLMFDGADQRVLHTKYDVGVEVLVTSEKDARDKRYAAGMSHHEMHVGRTVGMTVLRLQHVANGTVIRDGIEGRYDRAKPEVALIIGTETCAAGESLRGCQKGCVSWLL